MPRYAAIDIGSNSLRMMAAETAGRELVTLAEDRQVTRLGQGVFEAGRIADEAIQGACTVLARMAAAIRPLGITAVRAVATAAVRDASNRDEFLARAAEALGAPVEIISGQEEARLIHLGIESRWPHPSERILLVDIGGGSAEVIEADRGQLRAAFSRPLGALRLQTSFLSSDPPEPAQLRRMEESIDEKLAVAARRIAPGGFARAIGTSASAAAVVSAANRIPRPRRAEADRRQASLADVRRLYKTLATLPLAGRRKVAGIGPRRAEIIVPGAAVLVKVLERFRINRLAYCSAGVRDGILRDLADRGVGRERQRLDTEERQFVEQFARRFGVDLRHARKVASFARELFHALESWHRLPPEQGRLLEAAALLRDVGHAISDTGHHKHSHYIVANSDLAGFTGAEKAQVAILCRYHRKTMPTERHAEFLALPPEGQRAVVMLAPLLRIADALDRSRDQRVESLACEIGPAGLRLTIEARLDASLEIWAVERAAAEFTMVYERPLTAAAAS